MEHPQAAGRAAADAGADGGSSGTADGRDGAAERMERTVRGEPDTATHHQQQQSSSSAPSGVLDKLFGKRLVLARHYIISRKSWLRMVPTENCDILMTFPGTVLSDVSSDQLTQTASDDRLIICILTT
ncbi:anoctamin-8-like [Nothobranchius furzeri]|uniref:Anoctamin-8-like n=1 Tax=Nothobranchius furzeri TaxID=105023 RepID=A0A9D3BYY8_NOTFU|nr:anoctamin-8-like [Nothobranchius furzeri]